MIQQEKRTRRQSLKFSLKESLQDILKENNFIRKRMSTSSELNYLRLQRRQKQASQYASSTISVTKMGNQPINISTQFEDKFELKQKIGQGTQSVVYKCAMKGDQYERIYAVKTTKICGPQKLQTLLEQSMLLKSLKNSQIPKVIYFGVNQSSSMFYLVTEYFEYQTLRQYITRIAQNNQKISLYEQIIIVHSILKVLQYLHQKKISHRDIKPENILYNHKTWQLKLIDFDISKQNKTNQPTFMWTNTGTLYYKSPQMFVGDYGEKIDIWALGVILYELVNFQLPFFSEYAGQVRKQIMEKQLSYPETIFNSQIKDLIEKCLQKNPQKRISAAEAIQHSLFSQLGNKIDQKLNSFSSINQFDFLLQNAILAEQLLNCFQNKEKKTIEQQFHD